MFLFYINVVVTWYLIGIGSSLFLAYLDSKNPFAKKVLVREVLFLGLFGPLVIIFTLLMVLHKYWKNNKFIQEFIQEKLKFLDKEIF